MEFSTIPAENQSTRYRNVSSPNSRHPVRRHLNTMDETGFRGSRKLIISDGRLIANHVASVATINEPQMASAQQKNSFHFSSTVFILIIQLIKRNGNGVLLSCARYR